MQKIKQHEELKIKNAKIQKQIDELTEKEREHKEKVDRYHEGYQLTTDANVLNH